ncbi:MAG: ATP-dependent RNA helicase DbpA [Motiliproteus sp.]|nr:ATP-dependent RNA helicase DbpA [Motiliproteus sp.]MCW9052810.1 ATP-dependent RNA helicase DbpA [Motiliproteus sp.]
MSQTAFASLKLNSALVKNLDSLGYQEMTPIQAQSLPHVIAGRDVIAQAKTGSGKTAAFGLGLLDKLDVKRFRVQGLILCPTRELADQVAKELRRLARSIHNIKILTLCGGLPFGPQIGSLEHGAHIVVGTPGRIEEHLRKGKLKLNDLHAFVLDEADRMLDMGFQASLDAIVSHLPKPRQTLLFSATYPEQIESMAERVMVDPVMVTVEASHGSSSIQQHFYQVQGNDQRLQALKLLLLHFRPGSAIVFCNTKRETQAVADALRSSDLSAVALHGDLDQKARDQILVRFSNQSASILVATDVAARGLDIESVEAVINYHLAHDSEVHVHRIGRTGRAGRSGIACTLFSDREMHKIMALESYLKLAVTAEELPDEQLLQDPGYQPPMVTLQIDGGRKQKVRPGDILGALTGQNGIEGKQVGKINVFDYCAYVAVKRAVANMALKKLEHGKLKGRSFRVRRIRG